MKARTEMFIRLQFGQNRTHSLRVGPAQNASLIWGEADAQDQPHIDVARVADDALGEDQAGFDQHGEEEAVGNLLRTDVAMAGPDAFEDGCKRRVIRAARSLGITVEASAGFLP